MTNQIVQAVLLGGYYALIACGLAFMFQVMRIINLAHGSLAVMAGYGIWAMAEYWGLSPFLGVLLIVPVVGVLGLGLQRGLLERSARGGDLLPILTTFGLAIVVDNLLFQQFSLTTRSLSPYLGDLTWASFQLPGGIWVGQLPVYLLLAVLVLLGGLHLILTATALGRQIRVTAEDPVVAGLVGVDARRAAAIAAAIAMMTVALSVAALGLRSVFEPYVGGPQLLFAFEATIIGGTRSLRGVLVGGIVLALAQTFGASIHPEGFLLGGHIAFLVVLVFRLRGNGLRIRSLIAEKLRGAA